LRVLRIDTSGLEAFIEQKVREVIAEALGERPEEDPWLDSKAAAAHLGVSRQRIHDLVCSGDLARVGEKGERLFFRRSTLDAYREGRSLGGGIAPEGATDYRMSGSTAHENAPAARERSGADHGG
jgi:predicted ATPase